LRRRRIPRVTRSHLRSQPNFGASYDPPTVVVVTPIASGDDCPFPPLTMYVHEPGPRGVMVIVVPEMTALAIPAHVVVPIVNAPPYDVWLTVAVCANADPMLRNASIEGASTTDPGVGVGEGDGVGESVGVGVAVGDGNGLGDGDRLGDGDGDGDALAVGAALGSTAGVA
jgi:hypothetical protein